MSFISSHRHLRLEQLENRRLLACVPIGSTQIECVSSEGPGTPENTWFRDQATAHVIEGYTSESSYAPGDTLELKVSSDTAVDYRVEVLRLGWYEGDGARLVGCIPNCTGGTIAATNQGVPAPDPVTLMVDANWSTTDAFVVPNDWASGYYLASLIVESGPSAGDAHFVPFIVNAESSRNADILVEVPTNTWQAYNSWGGHSLYDPQAADKVSFDRPYNNLDDILRYEYQLVRFLEREGYDVEYATNTDVHRDPTMLLDHSLVLSTGHDEYWTSEMRTSFESARDAGVDLAFFTSNAAYWQVRYEDAERTLVGYKVKPPTAGEDPEPDLSKKSMRFRELTPARPECSLIGVQYMSTATPGFTSDQAFYEDYTVNDALLTDSWFAGTGIQPGSTFPKIVGYEWDQIVSGCSPSAIETLFSYDSGTTKDAHSTRYTTPSGARVFSTGSMGFSYALDDWRFYGTAVEPASSQLQAFTRNMLNDLSARPDYEQSAAGDGLVVIEAEGFSRKTASANNDWTTIADASAFAGEAVLAGPDIGSGFSTAAGSPQLDYDINFVETGTHYIWIHGRAGGSTAGTSDSLHAGLDSVDPASARRIQNFTADYGWSTTISGGSRATIEVTTPGVHSLNLWMREDGFVADRIVLTTNPTLDIDSLLGSSTYLQSSDGDGLVVIEAEQFDATESSTNHAWTPITDVEASGGQGLLAGPDIGSGFQTTTGSPRVDYQIDFVETGLHYLWVLGKAGGVTPPTSDSVHAGIDFVSPPTATRIQGFTESYQWSANISGGGRTTVDIPSIGSHTLSLWMREDGFVADKIVLTTNPTLDLDSLLAPPSLIPSYFQPNDADGIVLIEAEQFDASRHTHNGVDLDNQLVSYWDFDGDVLDKGPASASFNDGVLTGSAIIDPSGLGSGSLRLLDGTGRFAIPDSSSINESIQSEYSIAFWLYAEDVSVSGKQILYEQGGTSRGLNLYIEDGILFGGGWNLPANQSEWTGNWIQAPVQQGQWYQVALTLDGATTVQPETLALWLNGVRVGAAEGSQVWQHGDDVAAGNLNQGTRFHDGAVLGTATWFRGLLDDLRIYQRVLRAEDTLALSESAPGNVTSDLVAHWDFNAATGSSVEDTAPFGNKNDGLLIGLAAIEPSGQDNGALRVPAASSRFSIPNSPDINVGIQAKHSISLWFYAEDLVATGKQIIYEQGGSSRGLNLYLDSGKLYAGGWNTPVSESGWLGNWLETDIEADQWHHAVLTLAGDQSVQPGALQLWLDGASVGIAPGSQLWSHGDPISAGSADSGTRFHDGTTQNTASYLRGRIDDIRIYKRQLKEADVRKMYSPEGYGTSESLHSWQIAADANASNGRGVFAGPDIGANISSGYASNSPRLDYYIDFTKTGTHYLWVLGRAAGSSTESSDSLHAGLDNVEVTELERIQGFNAGYSWTSTNSAQARTSFEVTSTGVHALNLWMREDGMQVDQILVTTNPTTDIQSLLAAAAQPPGAAGESAATPPLAMDTNRDGFVAPSDVLLIINHLNSEIRDTDIADRYDTNGDGFVSPIDALLVINELNRTIVSNLGAEGENNESLFDLAILSLEEELKRRRERSGI